jgi:DNA-binding response OmpR family regulator
VGHVVYAATQFRSQPIREASRQKRTAVLLVDPDPATLAAMEQALRDEGFVTATAFDEVGAVAAAQRAGTLDLLVASTDAIGIHAVGLVDAVRRFHPALQVLYTVTSEDELLVEGLAPSGDDDVLEKPFSGSELVEAVSSLLR